MVCVLCGFWRLCGKIPNKKYQNSGVLYIVNKIEKVCVFQYILNLIDIVVCVVFALYSSISILWMNFCRMDRKCVLQTDYIFAVFLLEFFLLMSLVCYRFVGHQLKFQLKIPMNKKDIRKFQITNLKNDGYVYGLLRHSLWVRRIQSCEDNCGACHFLYV